MKVSGLALEHFRNIESLRLEPGGGANIIYGDNAQGKTNLLEAIWLFSGTRSFRGAKDREYLPFAGGISHLHLDFEAQGRSQTADLAFGGEKKKVLLNEIAQKGASSLAGQFLAVVFSPDQLSMVKQGPEGRRRFLDTTLRQILPKYGNILDQYERILRQRAHLLKDCSYHPQLLDTLEVWDNHLAQYGAYLISVRARFTARLEQAACEIYEGISSGKESFGLAYTSNVSGELPADRPALQTLFLHALVESRREDMRLGATTVGPHRDDLRIEVGGKSARSFGSQGQQRSCVLALKLAECKMMEESTGEIPVVLLDDVMSELDENRRSYLLNHLNGRQVFITCCDVSAFSGLADGRIFQIKDGRLL